MNLEPTTKTGEIGWRITGAIFFISAAVAYAEVHRRLDDSWLYFLTGAIAAILVLPAFFVLDVLNKKRRRWEFAVVVGIAATFSAVGKKLLSWWGIQDQGSHIAAVGFMVALLLTGIAKVRRRSPPTLSS